MCQKERIQSNLLKIEEKLNKYKAKLIAVSKYYPAKAMMDAYSLGIRDFGESRLPDAVKKINTLEDEMNSNCNYHLIGHLQSNKIKWAVGFFKLIHSVDSIALAQSISEKASLLNIKQKILIQVNNAGEEQKSGIAPSQLEDMITKVKELPNIELMGLMNIAPLTDDKGLIKKLFNQMYNLKESYELKELSMGMSNDYEIALDSGATMIRLGRILFE